MCLSNFNLYSRLLWNINSESLFDFINRALRVIFNRNCTQRLVLTACLFFVTTIKTEASTYVIALRIALIHRNATAFCINLQTRYFSDRTLWLIFPQFNIIVGGANYQYIVYLKVLLFYNNSQNFAFSATVQFWN